jgi:hypothetical protein
LKYVEALKRGLAYLSRCNSGWFCHKEEDKYHRPHWCPDGLNYSQKCRVQRLHSLEEAEAKYLEMLKKARPNFADKVDYT